jgi:hypothetical protein
MRGPFVAYVSLTDRARLSVSDASGTPSPVIAHFFKNGCVV